MDVEVSPPTGWWKKTARRGAVSSWWSGILSADCLAVSAEPRRWWWWRWWWGWWWWWWFLPPMTAGPSLLVVSLAEWVDVCHGDSAILKNSRAAVDVFELFFPPSFLPLPPPPLPPPFSPREKMSNCQTAPSNSLPKPSLRRWRLPVKTVEPTRLIRSEMNVLIKNPGVFFFSSTTWKSLHFVKKKRKTFFLKHLVSEISFSLFARSCRWWSSCSWISFSPPRLIHFKAH